MITYYIQLIGILLGAYIVGSLPVGFWIAQLKGIADIRSHGSGNIGATNVARVLGVSYFFIVFVLDCCKAWGYLWLLHYSAIDYAIIVSAALLLLIGNGISFFLNGTGGKGVATACGILLALHPSSALFAWCVWAGAFVITQTVGLASLIAVLILPWYTWYASYDFGITMLVIFIMFWIVWRHASNIRQYVLYVGG